MDFSDIVETPTQPKPYWQTLEDYRKAAATEPEIAKMSVPEYASGINQLVGHQEHQENIQDSALRRGGVNISNLTRHFGGFDPGSTLDKLGVPSPSKLLGGPQEGVDLPAMAHRGAAGLATQMGASPGVAEAVGAGGEGLVKTIPAAAAGIATGIPGLAAVSALETYGETGSKLQAGISGTGAALIPKFMEGAGQAALKSIGAKTLGDLSPELANLLPKEGAATVEKLGKFVPSSLVERGVEFGAKQAGLTGNILGTQAAETVADPNLSWEDKLKNIGSEFSPSSLIATGIGQLPFTAMDLVHARTNPVEVEAKNIRGDFADRFTKAYQESPDNSTNTPPTNAVVEDTIDRLETGKPIEPTKVSVPVMITKRMEAELRNQGYTQEQINAMTPQDANDVLSSGKKPSVEKVLQSIGQVPIEADLKTLIHTSEGAWNPVEAIESTRTKANRMLLAQGMADPDNPPITQAHDPTLAYVLRGIDAKTLSKDDLSHLAASSVAEHWAGDREALKQSGFVPDADFPPFGQGTTPEKRFISYQLQSGVDERIAALTDPESKTYDPNVAQRIALVSGDQEHWLAAGIPEGLLKNVWESVSQAASEVAPELQVTKEQATAKPLLTNIVNLVSGLGPKRAERVAALEQRIQEYIGQHGIFDVENGEGVLHDRLQTLYGELQRANAANWERSGLDTGRQNVGAPLGDATFAARRRALMYDKPFDINDPKSIADFVRDISATVRQAEKNFARRQLGEPTVKDADGKAQRFASKDQAEEFANDANSQLVGPDQYNIKYVVPDQPEVDGTYRVLEKRFASLFGMPEVEREFEHPPEGFEHEEDTTEKPLVDDDAVPEGTTFDALSEASNMFSRRVTEINKHNDPAVVEGRKAAMVKNFSDFMQAIPDATFRDLWKAGTGKRVQEIDQWKKKFIRYVQFLGYGGDVVVKQENGRLRGVGDLAGLNKFMQELGHGKLKPPHKQAGEEDIGAWNRAFGGTNFFEKFALVTNFANRYMVDPRTALPDPEHRPIGDYGWLTPEFRRDLDKKVEVNWSDLPKFEAGRPIRPGVLNRDGTEYRTDLAGVTDKKGTILVKSGHPLADTIIKMTQHDLVMKAKDVIRVFKQLGGVDTTLAEELMRRLPFVANQNVGFSITRDPINRGYFHTDTAISSAGILADPYVFNTKGKLELMHPRDIFPIIMEELGHSSVDFAWNTDKNFKADVQRAYDHVKGHLDDLVKIGAEGKFAQLGLSSLRNPQEMLAGMFKDPNLHEFLKGIDDPEPFYQSGIQRSVFDKLYNMIKDLFTKLVGPVGTNTMLAKVASLTARGVEIQKGMPLVNRGDIYEFLYDHGLLSGEAIRTPQPEPVPKPGEPTQVYPPGLSDQLVPKERPGTLPKDLKPVKAMLMQDVEEARMNLSFARQDQFSPQGGDLKIAEERLRQAFDRVEAYDRGALNVTDMVDNSAVKDRESYVSDLQAQLIHTQGMQLSDPAARARQVETITKLTEEIKRNNELIVQLTKLANLKEGQVLESRLDPQKVAKIPDVVKDEKGLPIRFYHGSHTELQGPLEPSIGSGKVNFISFATDPKTAEHYAFGQRGYRNEHYPASIVPAYLTSKNPFDFRKPKHIKLFKGALEGSREHQELTRGEFGAIEPYSKELQNAGFDSFWTQENGLNLHVFDPKQVLDMTHAALGGSVLESRTDPSRVIDAMKASSLYLTEDNQGDLWFKPYNVEKFRNIFGPAFGDKLKLTENNGQWGYSIKPSETFNLTEADVARMPVPRMKPWAPSIFETMKSLFKQQGANEQTSEALAGYQMQFAALLRNTDRAIWGVVPGTGEGKRVILGEAWGYWKKGGISKYALDYVPETTVRHESAHLAGFHNVYEHETPDVKAAVEGVNKMFGSLTEPDKASLLDTLRNTTDSDQRRKSGVDENALKDPNEFAAQFMGHIGDVMSDVPKPSAYLREVMRFVPDNLSSLLQLNTLRKTQGLDRLQYLMENSAHNRGIKDTLFPVVKEIADIFRGLSRSALEIAEDQSEFYRTRSVYPDMYKGLLEAHSKSLTNFQGIVERPAPSLKSTLLESRMPPPIENMIRQFFNYPTSDGQLPKKLSWWDRTLMQLPQFALKYPVARSFVDMFTKGDVFRKTFRTKNQVALAGAFKGNRIYDDVRTKHVAQFIKSPTMKGKLSKIALELDVMGDFKYDAEKKAVGGDELAMDPTKLLQVTPQLTKSLMDKHGVTEAERPAIQTVLDGLRNQYINMSAAVVGAHQHELLTMLARGVTRNTDLSPEAARSTAQLLLDAVQKQATDTPAAVQALAQFQQQVPDVAVFQRLLDAAQKGQQNLQRLDRSFSMRSPYYFSEMRPGKFGLVWKDEKGNVRNQSFVDAKKRDAFVVSNKIKPERQTNPDSVAGINPNILSIIDEIHQQTVERAKNLFGEEEANQLGRLADFSTDLRESLNQGDILRETLGRKLQPGRDELDMFDTSQHYMNAASNAILKRFVRRESELLFTAAEFANEPEIKRHIEGQIEAYMKPDTQLGSFMRNSAFFYYLFGNPSSMIMQTSHQVMGLAPMLTRQGESVAGSFNMIRKANQAVIDAKRGGYKDPIVRDMVDRLRKDQGIQSWISRETDYNQDLSLVNRIRGTSGKPLWGPFDLAKNKVYQALDLGRRMYDIIPTYNSEVAFVASVMHLKGRKAEFGGPLSGDELYKEATFLRQNTMYTGGKENRPGFFQWMPRSAAQGLWSLQTYANGLTTEMGELIRRSFNPKGMTPAQTRQVRKAAAQMLLTQTAVSGVLGLPFATLALTGLQKLFPEMNVEQDIREALASLAGDDDAMGSFVSNAATMGIPSAMDYSPDLGSRFALHGVFHVSPYGDVGWEQLLGPAGGILTNALKGAQAGLEGRPIETVQSMMPVGFCRVWQSLEQGQTYKTQSGKIMANDLGPTEVVARMIGFRPARVRRIEDFERLSKVTESAEQEEQQSWTKKQVNLLKEGNDRGVQQNIAQRVVDKKGIYPARKLSSDVAEEYERQTMPVDTRKFGNRATVLAQKSLLGTLGTQTEGPSNTDRLQLQQQIAARLGIGGPSLSRFRHAAGVDQLLERYPHLTTPQASLLLNHAASSRPSPDLYQELLTSGSEQ